MEKRARVDAPVLFWRADGANGVLSNWSSLSVTAEDGTVFPTVEHYFMHRKALSMGDAAGCAAVSLARTPRAAKAAGRRVRNWDEAKWDAEREDAMLDGLRLKCAQHPAVRELLAATGDRVIGEASPRDAVWGIGLSPARAAATPPGEWPGRNMLGRAWMRARGENARA